jgi:hypothetical protein
MINLYFTIHAKIHEYITDGNGKCRSQTKVNLLRNHTPTPIHHQPIPHTTPTYSDQFYWRLILKPFTAYRGPYSRLGLYPDGLER